MNKAIIKFLKIFINNLSPLNLKKMYQSRYEKWFFLFTFIIVLTGTIIKVNDISIVICIWSLFAFFILKSLIILIYQTFLEFRYKDIKKIFGGNACIIAVKKIDNTLIFTLHSYVNIKEIIKMKNTIEQYLNTNIYNISQRSFNKRLIDIETSKFNKRNKNNEVNKLLNILREYDFFPQCINIKDNDFYLQVELDIKNTDIKKLLAKSEDISFRLKKHVDIEINKHFIFKIRKKNSVVLNFQDKIKERPSNMKLPALVGIDHETNKNQYIDISKNLHIFINGLTGSGKSCLFNSLIQSLMCWNNNICFLMIDFKFVEFRQYEKFINVVSIYNLDDFSMIINRVCKIMNQRYHKFDSCKNIEDYNHRMKMDLPYIIICIDECSYISTHKNQKGIWSGLIDIVQRGRACGVIVLSATQCPDHRQINTNFRRQVDTKICGRLRTQNDLEIVGIDTKQNIKKFQIGEFIIDGLGFDNKKIQGLYIDEQSKNGIYNQLKESLTYPHNSKNTQHIKLPTKQVLELISEINIKEKKSNFQELGEKHITPENDLYMVVEKFIEDKYNPGDYVPSFQVIVESFPFLNKWSYRKIKEKLFKEGKIYKSTPTSTKYKKK